jgi:hypothetical protein
MGRFPEYPLTPLRQVGAMCTEPGLRQGQLPWMILSPQGCSHQFVPGSSADCDVGCLAKLLKPLCKRLQPICQSLDGFGHLIGIFPGKARRNGIRTI